MIGISQPDAVYLMAEELRLAVHEALSTLDPGAPAISFVALGADEPWDSCCDGMLYVRVVQIQPTDGSVTSPASAMPCSPMGFAVDFEVVHLRCAPTISVQGLSAAVPTPEQTTDAAIELFRQGWAVCVGIACQARAWRARGLTSVMTPWTPVGPEGGCVGGITTLSVDLELAGWSC